MQFSQLVLPRSVRLGFRRRRPTLIEPPHKDTVDLVAAAHVPKPSNHNGLKRKQLNESSDYVVRRIFSDQSAHIVGNDASKIRIHVTAAGKELIAQWVMLSKAAKVAQVPEASFPFLVELASGLHKPLRIWQE